MKFEIDKRAFEEDPESWTVRILPDHEHGKFSFVDNKFVPRYVGFLILERLGIETLLQLESGEIEIVNLFEQAQTTDLTIRPIDSVEVWSEIIPEGSNIPEEIFVETFHELSPFALGNMDQMPTTDS